MPRHTNRTAAQKPRAGASRRKARPGVVRPRRKAAAPQPAVVGASLASLKLDTLAGADVFCRVTGIDSPEKPERMFTDLSASYMAAIEQWQGGSWEMMPWGLYGKTIGHAISYIIEDFEQRFCKDGITCAVNHDQNTGRYHFTVYRQHDSPEEWLVFETRKLLASVKRVSRPLYRLTLSFLACFVDRVGVPTWFNGGMEYAEDWVEENLAQQQMEGFSEYERPRDAEKEFEKAKEDLFSFRVGAAAACARDIRRAGKPVVPPEDIMKSLARIRASHPVKEAIAAGCELMKGPYKIDDFNAYRADDADRADIDGLPFYEQFLMLYEYDNALTASWEEWINGKANESGIMPPVISFDVKPEQMEYILDHLHGGGAWLAQLVHVFRLLSDAALYQAPIKKYK